MSQAEHVLLLFDFDGTLAPIVELPQNARILPEAREVLLSLATMGRCTTGFVSGRSLADLEDRVSVPLSHYSGNHGLEWRVPGLGLFRERLPQEMQAALRQLSRQIRGGLGHIPGILVEDKQLALSIHYRRVRRERVAEVLDYLVRLACEIAPLLEMHSGKELREIRPAGAPDKGRAVQSIVHTVQAQHGVAPLVFYFGDDEGDEPAFAAVAENGYGILVGKPKTASQAHYWISGPKQVTDFLHRCEGCLAQSA